MSSVKSIGSNVVERKLAAAALPFKDKVANDVGECYDILLEIDTNLRKGC